MANVTGPSIGLHADWLGTGLGARLRSNTFRVANTAVQLDPQVKEQNGEGDG